MFCSSSLRLLDIWREMRQTVFDIVVFSRVLYDYFSFYISARCQIICSVSTIVNEDEEAIIVGGLKNLVVISRCCCWSLPLEDGHSDAFGDRNLNRNWLIYPRLDPD